MKILEGKEMTNSSELKSLRPNPKDEAHFKMKSRLRSLNLSENANGTHNKKRKLSRRYLRDWTRHCQKGKTGGIIIVGG